MRQATVYDNSGLKGPRIVAQMSEGFIRRLPRLAGWTHAGTAITLANRVISHLRRVFWAASVRQLIG